MSTYLKTKKNNKRNNKTKRNIKKGGVGSNNSYNSPLSLKNVLIDFVGKSLSPKKKSVSHHSQKEVLKINSISSKNVSNTTKKIKELQHSETKLIKSKDEKESKIRNLKEQIEKMKNERKKLQEAYKKL